MRRGATALGRPISPVVPAPGGNLRPAPDGGWVRKGARVSDPIVRLLVGMSSVQDPSPRSPKRGGGAGISPLPASGRGRGRGCFSPSLLLQPQFRLLPSGPGEPPQLRQRRRHRRFIKVLPTDDSIQ